MASIPAILAGDILAGDIYVAAGDGYVASEERDGSTSCVPAVASDQRSSGRLACPRNLSAINTISNQWEMHTIIRIFSLFYLEVNRLFAIFANEKCGTGSIRFTLFL